MPDRPQPSLPTYLRTFGLRDNPFRPYSKLEGVSKAAGSNLDTKPLRLHEEERLEAMFVPRAGPFEQHLSDFRQQLELAGYLPGEDVEPVTSFAFLVIGKQGTGKSTLVNAMLQWVLKCRVTPPWVRVLHPPEAIIDDPPALAEYIAQKLAQESRPESYCCIVIEDLKRIDAARALKLWSEVTRDRTLMLFLVTNEEPLLDDVNDNERVSLTPYPTQPLTPDQAVELVRSRIAFFRDSAFESHFAAHPLFPFDEEDVRAAVERKTDKGEVVTLRTLNVSLRRVLEHRLRDVGPELTDGFDIRHVRGEDIAAHVLSVADTYAEMVA
jgi:hypothetical protein